MKSRNIHYFISDIHLSPEKPELCALFDDFIEKNAYQAKALYILGDLFDVWLGDDLMADFERQIAKTLANLADSGVAVYLVPGNRDFLLDQTFAQLAKLTLLKDPTPIRLYDIDCLLCHGDALCTEDRLYQLYRKVVQHPFCRFLFLHLSRKYRQKIARRLRANSQNYQMKQPQFKLDVTEAGVQHAIQQHPCQMIVHGHVHRAKHAKHSVNQIRVDRYVLGTWHKTGSVISIQDKPFFVQHHVFNQGDVLI